MLTKLKVDRLLSSERCRKRDLCVAMILSRLIAPSSKLALSRALDERTAENTLGELLGVENADEDECYAAMDWILERQDSIDKALAKRHLANSSLILYDVTSTYFEGRCCPLAKLGHSRDGKRDRPQIVVDLLSSTVFPGSLTSRHFPLFATHRASARCVALLDRCLRSALMPSSPPTSRVADA